MCCEHVMKRDDVPVQGCHSSTVFGNVALWGRVSRAPGQAMGKWPLTKSRRMPPYRPVTRPTPSMQILLCNGSENGHREAALCASRCGPNHAPPNERSGEWHWPRRRPASVKTPCSRDASPRNIHPSAPPSSTHINCARAAPRETTRAPTHRSTLCRTPAPTFQQLHGDVEYRRTHQDVQVPDHVRVRLLAPRARARATCTCEGQGKSGANGL